MDLVTQGLLGSTVAQAGYAEKIGKKAAIYGFLLGLVPDFDIISGFWGEWASLKFHRGPSHSLPLLALASLPLAWLLKKYSKSEAPLQTWTGMVFLSLFTHPLIDWCTTYGTPLFIPFTWKRYANDAMSIIDPLYSLPLLIAAFFGIFNLLTPQKRRALAVLALAVSSLYAFGGYRNSQNLIKEGKKIFAEQGFAAVEVRAAPTMFNTRIFRIVGRDQQRNFMVTYLKSGNGKPLNPVQLIEASQGPLVDQAMTHEIGRLFTWFAMDMICPVLEEQPDGSKKIILNDMRYGFMTNQNHSLFAAEAHFSSTGDLIGFTRKRGRGGQSFRTELKRMAEEFF